MNTHVHVDKRRDPTRQASHPKKYQALAVYPHLYIGETILWALNHAAHFRPSPLELLTYEEVL